MLTSFAQLREKAGAAGLQTVAVACAHDPHTLEAVLHAADEGLLRYVLIGHREEILHIGRTRGHEIDQADVISAETDQEAAEIAVSLVRKGKADFLQKGLMQTATILKAVVNREQGIGLGRPMSHTALLEPLVAAVCAAENVSPKIIETVDAAALKESALAGEFGSCCVEGPISFDLAVNSGSAKIKHYQSPVAGEADILLVPSIAAGNLMVKGLLEFAGAKMVGLVTGAKCPIALNSRSASFEEKYNSLLTCALVSGRAAQ